MLSQVSYSVLNPVGTCVLYSKTILAAGLAFTAIAFPRCLEGIGQNGYLHKCKSLLKKLTT